MFSFLLLFSSLVFSQTKIKSFYFENDQSVPTIYSQNQLDIFKQYFNKGEIRILEIYSYTDSIGSNTYNDTLAKKRLAYVSNRLELRNNSSIQLKPYGLEYKYDVKDYQNWRRVDIYFEYIVTQDSLKIDDQIKREEPNQIEVSNNIIRDPYRESIKDELPFILNISFKEGTAKIELRSFAEIKKLADYLISHPDAHDILIRGHVCCGNNMRISKNRAKAVYKELIKMGVDKTRLAYKGMSNKDPLVFPEKTNADRQRNRRVDVVFNTLDL
jgi:outer membrane protein OmpA-like peptidoglycan-associated protein